MIYTFHEDGTGQMTVDNERHVYDITWTLEDGALQFKIANWPYYNDTQLYIITTDKETPTFDSLNTETSSEAVFVPLGTVPFPTYEDNKPEELMGAWVRTGADPEATVLRAWNLSPKTERSWYGAFYPEDQALYLDQYFDDWNIVEDSLVFVFENGTQQRYTLAMEEDTMILTSEGGDQFTYGRMDLSQVEVNK